MILRQHQRWFILAAALALTGALGAVGAVSFQRRVEQFQPLGFEAQRTDGVWRVSGVDTSLDTGIWQGDQIYQVGGQQPVTPLELRRVLTASVQTELLVLRADELIPLAYTRPSLRVDHVYLVLCIIGVVYLLIGLFTLLKDSRRPGRLFFAWSLVSAALYVLSPLSTPSGAFDELIFLGDQLARTVLPPLTLHLFLVFPSSLRGASSPNRLVPFLYLPAAGLLAIHADWIFTGGRWLAGEPTAAKLANVDRLDLVLLVGFAIASVIVLAVRLRLARLAQRRQVQWIAIGMLGGYLPFAVLYVAPRVLGLTTAGWLALPAALPLSLVPLGFAYAILKYKLWDIEVILRDAISYSIAGLIGVFGFVLINWGISRGVGTELSAVRNLLSFVAGIGIAGVLVPVRGMVASRLERLRFGDRLAQRRALGRLGQHLIHERNLEDLCLELMRQLQSGLDLGRTTLYLSKGGSLMPARPASSLPGSLPVDAFGDGFWECDYLALEVMTLPGAPPTAAQRLFVAGYRHAFPLRVRDREIGVALISHHTDEAALATEDLTLVRGLLHQAALAIENAQLLGEVRRQLREVTLLEAHNKGIIESSPAGIAVVDADGVIREANRAFAAVVEVEQALIAGRGLAELVPVRPLPEPEDGVVEVSYCEVDGTERHLQLSIADHHGNDTEGLRILLVQDTSERMALAVAMQERERLASLGMVAAGVAHEVNTPLTGISSYAQLMLDDTPLEHPHRVLLEKMERQTFRASQIVNNLLSFARNRGDGHQPVTVARVLAECLETASSRATDAAVEMTLSTEGSAVVNARVLGNDGELAQVFNNLIANAIDAMASQPPRHERRLTVGIEVASARVRVTVRDTGPGIPSERVDRVFQPFFSSKLGSGGSGLGLAITHNIVRRHGGEIQVANTARIGCVFVVTLPCLADS